MTEPEIGLAFTADPWVEALHRHCSDHGGARVRALIVEPDVALEESYDVLVVGHRWPALTYAFVDEVHARGGPVLGVFDREEAAGRDHLLALGVDAVVASDAGEEAIIRSVVALVGARSRPVEPRRERTPEPAGGQRLVAIGGAPGAGRTEVAIALSVAVDGRETAVLIDADDVGPGVAPRLGLEPTPNLCDAIDAVEHGRGELAECLQRIGRGRSPVLVGLGHRDGWHQVRPGEVCRVVDRLGAAGPVAVVDGVAPLDDVPTTYGRSRHATARALVLEAAVSVAVVDATPVGIGRGLDWIARAREIAPTGPIVVAANRAPADRFRRSEIVAVFGEVLPEAPVVFLPDDPRVAEAAWAGRPVGGGPFVRAVERLTDAVLAAMVAEEAAA
ncbi:MAG: hypothetical protein ACKOBG_04640 [Actinomycetota bacterium]